MAYDEKLAARVRKTLARHKAVAEIKMFGGLCITLRGNMCCGILKSDLMVRVDPSRYKEVLALPHSRPMNFTGKPMKGFVFVGPAGTKTDVMLRRWIKRSMDFVSTLPFKIKDPGRHKKR